MGGPILMQIEQRDDSSPITKGLTRALGIPIGRVREKAAFGLALVPGTETIDPLLTALTDADAQVREKAAIVSPSVAMRASWIRCSTRWATTTHRCARRWRSRWRQRRPASHERSRKSARPIRMRRFERKPRPDSFSGAAQAIVAVGARRAQALVVPMQSIRSAGALRHVRGLGKSRGQRVAADSPERHRPSGPEPAGATDAFGAGGPGDAPIFTLASQPCFCVGPQTPDLVLIDLRGTRQSSALTCPELGQRDAKERSTRKSMLNADAILVGRVSSNAALFLSPLHDGDRR